MAPSTLASPLRTAIVDPGHFDSPQYGLHFDRTRSTGATMVRLVLTWRAVETARPTNPTDPDDPAYNWGAFDDRVTGAIDRGLQPIITVGTAPDWASDTDSGTPGTFRPDAVKFGQFARAAARRYSGSFVPNEDPYLEPLPAVRYWQAWNEPNRDYFFRPQYDSRGRIVSPALYRDLVNRFADGVRAVDARNVVIAGGLAPLGRPGKPAPMNFMRSFLSAPAKFDVWAHHPYTSGGPTHKAAGGGDVSLGDLPGMRAVLQSNVRAGRVRSTRAVQFWVTEFSWDSNPPDRRALPASIHARWVSEALYRMWKNGVTMVAWYKVTDDPMTGPKGTHYQSGFFTTSGAAKRSLTAFRFPTVALRESGGILVWGRTPTSRGGRVDLQIKVGSQWRLLGRVTAKATGIFTKRYRTPIRKGSVRARFAGATSLPFSLTPVRDRYVNPFGCGGVIPC